MAIIRTMAQTARRSIGAQFTESRDGIEPAPMERMAAGEPTSREPRAPQRTMPSNGFERVLRAGGRKATGGRQGGRDGKLIAPDDSDESSTRQPGQEKA
jgi:hypothetical protein